MAYTSFMRGDNTKMTNTPYTDGLIFLNTEEQALYLDDNNERIPMGGAGTGGHIIENNAGTDMTERTNLQFGGVYVSDDETNDRTKVNVTRNMSKDDFDQLTTAEKLGVIVTTNDPNDYVPFSADMVEYDNTNSGMTATDVQDAIDELNSDIVNAGTVRYNDTDKYIQVYDPVNEVWVNYAYFDAQGYYIFKEGVGNVIGFETLNAAGSFIVSLAAITCDAVSYDGGYWCIGKFSVPNMLNFAGKTLHIDMGSGSGQIALADNYDSENTLSYTSLWSGSNPQRNVIDIPIPASITRGVLYFRMSSDVLVYNMWIS